MLADYPNLPTAPRELVMAGRNAYFEIGATRTPLAPGNLVIDKNPLLMGAVPLIRRMFPDAQIILALRHPCDVALSCFTTNFKLNDGMSNFLRLDTDGRTIRSQLQLFRASAQLLPRANVHTVKYESLVANREHELRSLFDFLGLDWHDDVLDHAATALGRGRIKTASYAQVMEPIY